MCTTIDVQDVHSCIFHFTVNKHWKVPNGVTTEEEMNKVLFSDNRTLYSKPNEQKYYCT